MMNKLLSKEATWAQHLGKDQYIGDTKIPKDPTIRQCQVWLSEKFTRFDYTNDARFETIRNYPRNKQLFRKHRDISTNYERKLKFYKKCQRMYSKESNKQIQKAEERFSKLLKYTVDSNNSKTKGLQLCYSRWTSKHTCGKDADFDKIFEKTIQTLSPSNWLQEAKVSTPVPTGTSACAGILQSFRSVSVDNITQVEADEITADVYHGTNVAISVSGINAPELGKETRTHTKRRENLLKTSLLFKLHHS